MMKKIFLALLATFSFVFMSCPQDCEPEEHRVFGKYIDNLPEWTKAVLVSEWEPWNTEKTVELKKLFKQKQNLNSNANINYRLFVTGQNIVLFFDDEERTACNPLWIWVSEYETGNYFISIPQRSDNEFIFEGHAKSNTFEKNTEQNKAYVKIELLDEKKSNCNYTLKVNGVTIIDKPMKACTNYFFELRYNDLMDRFGYSKKDINPRYTKFYPPVNLSIIGDEDNRFSIGEFLYFNEGLSPLEEVNCDLNENTLTYKLLGGTENMCHYMDIQFVTKDEINCHFYDLIDGEKNIRYTELLD